MISMTSLLRAHFSKLTLWFLLLVVMGCGSDKYPSEKVLASGQKSEATNPNFDIGLDIKKLENSHYLSVSLELFDGAFVVSPYSKDTIFGHFDISIADMGSVITEGLPLELPSSIEEFDPVLEAPVRFVRTNTTFTQKLNILTKEDFQVSGLIWFVLEPSCVPYDVEFTLSSQNGILKVEKTKTAISKGYSG